MELQLGSPYLVEFGPLFFDYLTLIVVKIRSQDGGEWILKKLLDPINTKRHTYSLTLIKDGGYQVSVDNQTVAEGKIQNDFTFKDESRLMPDPDDTKPDDWDDDPFRVSEQLLERLKSTPPFIGTFVNPEYLSLEQEAESSFNP